MRRKGLTATIGKWVCIIALGVSISFTGTTAYADEEETETADDGVPNNGIERVYEAEKCYSAEAVTREPETEVEIGSGLINEENESYEYQYTAPRSGRYYAKLTDVSASSCVAVYVWDNLGNEVVHMSRQGGDETMIELEEGTEYTIRVCRSQGYNSNFKFSIIPPKEKLDISELSEIHDQISFYDQRNYYTFKAKYSGNYNFCIEDKTANAEFSIGVWDPYDTAINDYNSGSCTLEADTEYTVRIAQDTGIGNYTLKVYQKKETIDISGYTQVDDSIEFKNQINSYNFVAPAAGTYKIQLANLRSNYEPQFAIWDESGEVVAVNTSGLMEPREHLDAYENGCELEEGKKYYLEVREHDAGVGDYSIAITYPSDAYAWLEELGAVDDTSSGTDTSSNKNTKSSDESDAEETDTLNTADSAELASLKEENEEMKEQLEEMQNQYDELKKLMEDNGIVSDE